MSTDLAAPAVAPTTPPYAIAKPSEAPLPPLWRNWRFQLIWAGSSVSFLGMNVADFAYPVVILAMTGSPAMASMFAFIQIVASMATGLPAGTLVDRYDRRKVLLALEAGRTLVSASVVVAWALGHLTLAHLLVVAAVLGAASPLSAARMLVVRAIVPPQQLTRALTQDEVRTAAGGLAGPPLGGVLLAAGRALPFLACALTFLVSFISVLIVQIPPSGAKGAAQKAAAQATSQATSQEAQATSEATFQATSEATSEATRRPAGGSKGNDGGALQGIRELWANRTVRGALLMLAMFNVGGTALFLAVVVILQGQGASPGAIGIAVAGDAVGNLIGAGLVGRLHARMAPGKLLLLVTSMFAVLLPLLAIPLGPWWVFGVLAAAMLGVPAVRVLIDVLILRQVPDERRGRTITALVTVLTMGVPFGTLAGGLCLQFLGASATILAMCGITAIAVLVGAKDPALRVAQWPAS